VNKKTQERWIFEYQYRIRFYVPSKNRKVPKSLKKQKTAYRYAPTLEKLVDRIVRLGYCNVFDDIEVLEKKRKNLRWISVFDQPERFKDVISEIHEEA